MMPLKVILQKKIIEPVVIDLEEISGLLNHHNLYISASNGIASDCGDRWICSLNEELDSDREIRATGVTLRKALINVFKEYMESKNAKGK